MADPAEGGGSEQDDVSFLRTVSKINFYFYEWKQDTDSAVWVLDIDDGYT